MSNSRLPHTEPLIFIEVLQQQTDDKVTFQSSFPSAPSLAMLCEASAQGTSFFPLSHECEIGFVSSFRNVTLFHPCTELTPSISITLVHSFDNSYLFGFEVFNGSTFYASGEIAMFYTVA
jgi:hypothetical protein